MVGTPACVWAIISLLVFEGVAKTIDPELDFQGISYGMSNMH